MATAGAKAMMDLIKSGVIAESMWMEPKDESDEDTVAPEDAKIDADKPQSLPEPKEGDKKDAATPDEAKSDPASTALAENPTIGDELKAMISGLRRLATFALAVNSADQDAKDVLDMLSSKDDSSDASFKKTEGHGTAGNPIVEHLPPNSMSYEDLIQEIADTMQTANDFIKAALQKDHGDTVSNLTIKNINRIKDLLKSANKMVEQGLD